jgi:hypothetical protein
MNGLPNFDSEGAAYFQRTPLVASVIFSLSVASAPQPAPILGKTFRPSPALDGERPPSHGAAMTIIRNRFFGICREIISA